MRISIVLLLLFSFCSCKSFLFYDRKKFTSYKQHEPRFNPLRLDGAYVSAGNVDSSIPSFNILILYADGTVYDAGYIRGRNELDTYLQEEIVRYTHPKSNSWGAYIVDNKKNIELQRWEMRGSEIASHHHLHMITGKVLSDTSFIFHKYFLMGKEVAIKAPRPYYFYPFSNKPDSTNWMMNDKGFNKRAERFKQRGRIPVYTD